MTPDLVKTPALLPLADAAILLGVPIYSVRRWVREEKLPYVLSGKKYYIPQAAIVKFLTNIN